MKKAYIDIETDYVGNMSLDDEKKKYMDDHENHKITILGIYLVDGDEKEVIQLVDDKCTREKILEALSGVEELVTFHGSSTRWRNHTEPGFDFPVIYARTGLKLDEMFPHTDLCVVGWEKDLRGGLKKIEKKFRIKRKTVGMDGEKAMYMWREYKKTGDLKILEKIKLYNEEDIVNLVPLEQKLIKYKRS